MGELADQSEPVRRVLAQCFAQWQSYLSEGFEAMRDNGELAAQADPPELALTVISALQGGLLMAQATRSARPLLGRRRWPGAAVGRPQVVTPGLPLGLHLGVREFGGAPLE